MTKKEKWAKYNELHAQAAQKHAEWRELCKQIDAVIRTLAEDEPMPASNTQARLESHPERNGNRRSESPMKPACERCPFWVEFTAGADKGRGECHRRAPQVATRVYSNECAAGAGTYAYQVESETHYQWPETESTDWCGDFQDGVIGE
jgi:hypothetical protein